MFRVIGVAQVRFGAGLGSIVGGRASIAHEEGHVLAHGVPHGLTNCNLAVRVWCKIIRAGGCPVIVGGRIVGTMGEAATQTNRQVELHIPSELGWERVAMSAASSVAERMGFPRERIEDIKTAVAEATLNAIEHGNHQDATRKVYIILASEEEGLKISVLDHSSKPFSPLADTDRPDLTAKLAGQEPLRGWGTFLINALVDEVEYSTTNSGNLVRMVIHLEPLSVPKTVAETKRGKS